MDTSNWKKSFAYNSFPNISFLGPVFVAMCRKLSLYLRTPFVGLNNNIVCQLLILYQILFERLALLACTNIRIKLEKFEEFEFNTYFASFFIFYSNHSVYGRFAFSDCIYTFSRIQLLAEKLNYLEAFLMN